MIAAGYTIDLYCDCRYCEGKDATEYRSGFRQYAGETWAECARAARSDGWYISRDKTICFAPGHVHKSGQ